MSNKKFKAELEHYDSDAAVKDALEKQFSELWNKVADGLPDDDIDVLVYCELTDVFHIAHHDDDEWITDEGDLLSRVSHWMDLIPPATRNPQLETRNG